MSLCVILHTHRITRSFLVFRCIKEKDQPDTPVEKHFGPPLWNLALHFPNILIKCTIHEPEKFGLPHPFTIIPVTTVRSRNITYPEDVPGKSHSKIHGKHQIPLKNPIQKHIKSHENWAFHSHGYPPKLMVKGKSHRSIAGWWLGVPPFQDSPMWTNNVPNWEK